MDAEDGLKLGRVKCTIAEIFDDTDPDNLPWCFPKNGTGLGGQGTSSGDPVGGSSFFVPEVGSELLVTFPYGDIYTPVYSGYFQSSLTHQTFFNDDYPNSYGFADSVGNKIKVNKTSGAAEVDHQSGAKFTLDTDGNMVVTIPGNLTANVTGNLSATVSGTVDIEATGNVTVNSSGNTYIKGSGGVGLNTETLSGETWATSSMAHQNVIDTITGIPCGPSTVLCKDW